MRMMYDYDVIIIRKAMKRYEMIFSPYDLRA